MNWIGTALLQGRVSIIRQELFGNSEILLGLNRQSLFLIENTEKILTVNNAGLHGPIP